MAWHPTAAKEIGLILDLTPNELIEQRAHGLHRQFQGRATADSTLRKFKPRSSLPRTCPQGGFKTQVGSVEHRACSQACLSLELRILHPRTVRKRSSENTLQIQSCVNPCPMIFSACSHSRLSSTQRSITRVGIVAVEIIAIGAYFDTRYKYSWLGGRSIHR